MGLAEKYIPHYTIEEWTRWEGLWELIEGHPIALIPSPPPAHQLLSGNIQSEFQLAIKKEHKKECILYPTIGYKISDDTIFAPDITLVLSKITKDLLDYPPVLVVEVLTAESEERDRGIKYNYYEKEGVKYYLIADWKKKSIEVYELIDSKYQLQDHQNRFEFHLNENCKISPELNTIWE